MPKPKLIRSRQERTEDMSKTKRPLLPPIIHEVIHPAQWDMADKIMEVLFERHRTPFGVRQFQDGKTGTMLALTHRFMERCARAQLTFQVWALCGMSDLALASQTHKRFTTARSDDDGTTQIGADLDVMARQTGLTRYPEGFEDRGVVVHQGSSKLKKINLSDTPVDQRLVIIDEADVGLVKYGNIDTFLRSGGVNISEQIHLWDSSRTVTHVVPFSATPFAYTTLSREFAGVDSADALFQGIYGDPGAGYNSIEVMLGNGRLQEVFPLFDKDNGLPTDFLKRVLSEFKLACKLQGPGYLVFRVTGEREVELLKFIHAQNMEYLQFNSTSPDARAIKELNKNLSRQPAKPTLVLIKGAMRAGITLKQNHVRGWIETRSKQIDTQGQAGMGRACGYNRHETYPIYCDTNAAKEMVKYFEFCKRGRFDYVAKNRNTSRVDRVQVALASEAPEMVEVILMTHDQAKALKDKLTAASGQKPKGRGHKSVYQITSTAGQKVMLKTGLVLRGQFDTSHRDDGTNVTMGYLLNGPGTGEKARPDRVKAITRQQKADWDNLMKAHPTWRPTKKVEWVVVPAKLVEKYPEWTVGMLREWIPVVRTRTIDSFHRPKSSLKQGA